MKFGGRMATARYALLPSYRLVTRLFGFGSSLPITTADDGAALFASNAPDYDGNDSGLLNLAMRLRMILYCSVIGQPSASLPSDLRKLCLAMVNDHDSTEILLYIFKRDLSSAYSFPQLPAEAQHNLQVSSCAVLESDTAQLRFILRLTPSPLIVPEG